MPAIVPICGIAGGRPGVIVAIDPWRLRTATFAGIINAEGMAMIQTNSQK